MKRVIRPAEEEMGGVVTTLLFSVLWYSAIGSFIFQSGFQTIFLVFLIAGLMLPYQAVTSIRRALFYRRQRSDAIAHGDSCRGKIVGITRQDVPYYSTGKHRQLRYRRYYYLEVEMTDPDTGISSRIQSQGYRRPIHRYLGSDRVTVYTDKSGWKHYLEEFQWKEHRSDPDIFDYPREFEEVHLGSERVGQIIFAVVVILMILNMLNPG